MCESKGKNKANSLQLELEESFKKFEELFVASLERNIQLERDLVYIKQELQKSLK